MWPYGFHHPHAGYAESISPFSTLASNSTYGAGHQPFGFAHRSPAQTELELEMARKDRQGLQLLVEEERKLRVQLENELRETQQRVAEHHLQQERLRQNAEVTANECVQLFERNKMLQEALAKLSLASQPQPQPPPPPPPQAAESSPRSWEGGVGLELCDDRNMEDFTVSHISPNSPAEKCGMITLGDRLIGVDIYSVKGRPLSVVGDFIKGPIGTQIKLHFKAGDRSPHRGEYFEVTLDRYNDPALALENANAKSINLYPQHQSQPIPTYFYPQHFEYRGGGLNFPPTQGPYQPTRQFNHQYFPHPQPLQYSSHEAYLQPRIVNQIPAPPVPQTYSKNLPSAVTGPSQSYKNTQSHARNILQTASNLSFDQATHVPNYPAAPSNLIFSGPYEGERGPKHSAAHLPDATSFSIGSNITSTSHILGPSRDITNGSSTLGPLQPASTPRVNGRPVSFDFYL